MALIQPLLAAVAGIIVAYALFEGGRYLSWRIWRSGMMRAKESIKNDMELPREMRSMPREYRETWKEARFIIMKWEAQAVKDTEEGNPMSPAWYAEQMDRELQPFLKESLGMDMNDADGYKSGWDKKALNGDHEE